MVDTTSLEYALLWVSGAVSAGRKRILVIKEMGRMGWLSLPLPKLILRLRAARRVVLWCTIFGVAAGGSALLAAARRERPVPSPWDSRAEFSGGDRIPPGTVFESWRPGDGEIPVSVGAVASTRLRRHARWVCRLQRVLGGDDPLGWRSAVVARFLSGRWTPDLPGPNRPTEQNFLLDALEGGARILGGGSVGCGHGEPPAVFWTVETRDGSVSMIFPDLLAKLRAYAYCRRRDASLVGALRLRAVEWCKQLDLSPVVTFMALEGVMRHAWVRGRGEALTVSVLRTHGAEATRWWDAGP